MVSTVSVPVVWVESGYRISEYAPVIVQAVIPHLIEAVTCTAVVPDRPTG